MAKYKWNKTRDFRTEKPELVRTNRDSGGWAWIQGCDEWMGGKWEGFVALRGRVYKTKGEALKHRPQW